jgi:hypothetical protein
MRLSTNEGCQSLKQRFESELPGDQLADPKLRPGPPTSGVGSMTKQIRNVAASHRAKLLALARDRGEHLGHRGGPFAIRDSRM